MNSLKFACSPIDSGAATQHKNPSYQAPQKIHRGEVKATLDVMEIQPPISFGENYDLIVKIRNKNQEARFLAVSSVLGLASQVWGKMVKSTGFAELKRESINGTEYPLLDLQDDDVEALTFLLKIFHLQLDGVPKVLKYNQLRSIAIISDKYNCWPALRLWTEVWFTPLIKDAVLPGYEDWLFIATKAGYHHSNIEAMKNSLVRESGSLSLCGTYLIRYKGSKTHVVSCELLPQTILGKSHRKRSGLPLVNHVDSIMCKRSTAVDAVVSCLQEFVRLVGTPQCSEESKNTLCQERTCRNIALGSLYESLKQEELWPLVHGSGCTHSKWHSSLENLMQKIRSLKMTTVLEKQHVAKGQGKPVSSHVQVISNTSPSPFNQISRSSQKSVYGFGMTHSDIIKQFKPKHEGQHHDYTIYESPAFRGVSYQKTPCELAYKFGDFCLEIEKHFHTASAGHLPP